MDFPKAPIIGSLATHLQEDPRESERFGEFLKEVLRQDQEKDRRRGRRAPAVRTLPHGTGGRHER